MEKIEITTNSKILEDKLKTIATKYQDTTTITASLSQTLLQHTEKQFEQEGYPNKWHKLSPEYARERARKDSNYKILTTSTKVEIQCKS